MAFIAVTSLMRTLELQFLHPHPRVILTNKDQIKSLHGKLGHLLVFLEECEKKANNNSTEMKEVEKKIRQVSVKAEDEIEKELLEVHRYHKIDQTLQRIVEDIEELMKITRNVEYAVVKQFDEVTIIGGSSQPTSNVEDHNNEMVGHSEELIEVMSQLLRDKQRQVIAMVGMGGIGKTTFAKKIYNDPTVKSYFDLRAWTTISQEYNKNQALTDLCHCINIKAEGDLQHNLLKSLLGKRYLIIVDDIWTVEAWDDIERCFPDENNGSRILLTTRDREIAKYANNSGEYSYNMRFLDPTEGWDLFNHKFLDKSLFLNNEFETIGKNIVQKCQGLPLSIVVVAGLLSTINKSVDEWKNIEAKINSLLTLNLHEQFSRILTLSYNNLPSHLKGCFLYLAVFPEDCDIPVKKLIRLWIAEGFIDTMSPKMLEEVGVDYLQDLIGRSLVMVHGRSFDGKIKTCRMHDLLRDLCVSKARQENLLYLETESRSQHFDRLVSLDDRWLSLKTPDRHFHFAFASTKCRSILCISYVKPGVCQWYLYAKSFKKLRVLDLSKISLEPRMPPDITDLVFLRYISLGSSKVLNCIPLWKNWNLQTLVIDVDDNGTCKLPPGIWDLPQLRHLEAYHQVPIDHPRVVQENLQTLYWLSMSQCTMEVLQRIPNIKELGIIDGREVAPHGLNNVCCLNFLEYLKVQGCFQPLHLPPQGNILPQNLKKLTFVRTFIPWEAMSIISMLPNLAVLNLKNFACVGQEWELIEEGGFQQLKVLFISLTNLKEWKSYYPFPKLERLLLRNCFELKELPEWFEDILTLKLIKMEYCYASLVSSAQRIKNEQLDNYGIEDLDVNDINTRPDDDHVEEEEEEGEEEKEECSSEQTCGEKSVPHCLTSVWFEARKLSIGGSTDPEIWIWIRDSESGQEVAVLEKQSWFSIHLKFDIRCLCKKTCYSTYFVFKLGLGCWRNVHTALASVCFEQGGQFKWMGSDTQHSQIFLAKKKSCGDFGRFPNIRSDGWMEINLGDFYVCSGNEGRVIALLWHTSDQFWKSGLVVRGIHVRQCKYVD